MTKRDRIDLSPSISCLFSLLIVLGNFGAPVRFNRRTAAHFADDAAHCLVGNFRSTGIGVVIDGLIFAGIDMGVSGPILGVILGSIIFMEIGSLMEIAAQLNPDLQAIKAFKLLATVKENATQDGKEEGKHVA